MHVHFRNLCTSLILCASSPCLIWNVSAQEVSPAPGTLPQGQTVVPPLVRYTAASPTRAGDTLEAVFSVYGQPEGGEPLWSETQRVTVAQDGRYTVLLGVASDGGIPARVFAGGQGRWVGVSFERAPEAARTPLLSVPYAMKAGDADSVGGLAASSLVTQAQLAQATRDVAEHVVATVDAAPELGAPTGTGNTGSLPIWTSPSTLGNSAIYQGGTATVPLVGVNTTSPGAILDVNGSAKFRNTMLLSTGAASTAASGIGSPMLMFNASSFLANGSEPTVQTFAWQVLPTNNNTSSPSATMSLLYSQTEQKLAPTGFSIEPSGVVNFAPDQNFPGTITSIQPGFGLTGGGVSNGVASLNVDPTYVPVVGNANTFTAAQSFSAGLTEKGASSFTGPSNGLIATSTATAQFIPGVNNAAGVIGNGPAGVVGYGQGVGVYGTASSSTGTGVSAIGNWGLAATGVAIGAQVTATGATSTGVSAKGAVTGVSGTATLGTGVGVTGTDTATGGVGMAATGDAIGVNATATNAKGTAISAFAPATGATIGATSQAGIGIHATVYGGSKITAPWLQYLGPFEGVGVWADSSADQTALGTEYSAALVATADNSFSIVSANNSASWPTIRIQNDGTGSTSVTPAPVLQASGAQGACLLNTKGESICTGGHQTAVNVAGGSRQVAMYAMHAAENWFEDFGTGQLENGATVVKIDPAFAGTINGQMDYHVFLTPRGDCEGLYVSNETPASFEVHELRKGTSTVAFDYRITARRAGHEAERMKDVTAQMQRAPRLSGATDSAGPKLPTE